MILFFICSKCGHNFMDAALPPTIDRKWTMAGGTYLSWVPYMLFGEWMYSSIITFPHIVNSSQIRCILLVNDGITKWIHCPSTS